jgi:hypothetical protein
VVVRTVLDLKTLRVVVAAVRHFEPNPVAEIVVHFLEQ